MDSRTPNRIPVGLRKPWQWIQPKTTSEIITRLIEASDFMVHERERENLCSVAAAKIRTLDKDLTAANERLRMSTEDAEIHLEAANRWSERAVVAEARLLEVEKDARRYRWLRGNAQPGVFHIAFAANTLSSWKTSNEIDATIDAALAGAK